MAQGLPEKEMPGIRDKELLLIKNPVAEFTNINV
jgi:hypothetical protein